MADDPSFFVLRIAPGPKTALWTYCTVGASLAAAGSTPLEFFILAPRDEGRLIEMMTMVAHYHRTEKLGLFHTFPVGKPWLDDSECDSLLVSLPYPFGESLELMDVEGVRARILWLLPITAAERLFVKQNGIDALEENFDAEEIDYSDVSRPSVI